MNNTENKINWKQKLSSRKMWAAIIGVIVGVAAAFGIDGNDYTELAGIVTSLISIVTFILAEGKVDEARENAKFPLNINFPETAANETPEESETPAESETAE